MLSSYNNNNNNNNKNNEDQHPDLSPDKSNLSHGASQVKNSVDQSQNQGFSESNGSSLTPEDTNQPLEDTRSTPLTGNISNETDICCNSNVHRSTSKSPSTDDQPATSKYKRWLSLLANELTC